MRRSYTGFITTITTWSHYGDQKVASLRRSQNGSIAPISNIAIRTPEVDPARESQGVHAEVNSLKLASHPGERLAPVVLHLPAGRRLEAYCRQAFPHRPPGVDILPQNDRAPGIPFCLKLPENHHRVPYTCPEKLIYSRFEGIELALPGFRPFARRAPCRFRARLTVFG